MVGRGNFVPLEGAEENKVGGKENLTTNRYFLLEDCDLHTVGMQGSFHGHPGSACGVCQIKAGNLLQGNLPGAGGVRLFILSLARFMFLKNLAAGYLDELETISFTCEIEWLIV